jgi:hypothetical protein
MNNLIHSLTDAFALASAALDKGQNGLPNNAAADNALFNVFVIDENGVRTLVRENITAQLSGALVSSANHGAKVQGLARTYEAEQLEAIN